MAAFMIMKCATISVKGEHLRTVNNTRMTHSLVLYPTPFLQVESGILATPVRPLRRVLEKA